MAETLTSKFAVTIKLQIADHVLDEVMKPEWQNDFYKFADRQAAADHIAYNVARGASLTSLDGFAHFDDGDVVVKDEDWDIDND